MRLFIVFAAVVFHMVMSQEESLNGQCHENDHECLSKTELSIESDAPAGVKIAKGSNKEGRPPEVSLTDCSDRHQQCIQFERQGECNNNPGWMIVNCPKSCKACHLRDAKVRCQRATLNISTEPIYKPGDLNWMFANIAEEFPHYGITVISQSPWIVTFDNFLTDEETDALIATNEGNWERSTDTGSVNE